jgi:signal transduction histidine kinase
MNLNVISPPQRLFQKTAVDQPTVATISEYSQPSMRQRSSAFMCAQPTSRTGAGQANTKSQFVSSVSHELRTPLNASIELNEHNPVEGSRAPVDDGAAHDGAGLGCLVRLRNTSGT